MDSGDQPTCSKYYREPEQEDNPVSPPPPEQQQHEDGREEEEQEEIEPSGWQLTFPSPLIREMGNVLQLPEIKNLRLVCRNWTAALDAAFLKKARREAVNATSYQWEPIHYSHALYAPRIYPRMFHCGAHHPMTNKIYIFGGNGLQRRADAYDFDANYNDVWTFDLRRKCWERLLVPDTPYPMPKSRASMVAWRQYLVLFGGFRRPNRRGPMGVGAAEFHVDESDDVNSGGMVMPDRGSLPYEIHYLDVMTNLWETATPVPRDGGINFLGLHDHAAAVVGKWMVVVGGLRSTPWDEGLHVNADIYLFDLEERMWHKAPRLWSQSCEEMHNKPKPAELARGMLALVRPGRLLYHPCFPIGVPARGAVGAAAAAAAGQNAANAAAAFVAAYQNMLPIQRLLHQSRDSLNAYFLDYDPANVLGVPWRWTPVPVASPHILRAISPLAPPVAVACDERVHLINLVAETVRVRRDSDLDSFHGLQSFAVQIKREIRARTEKSETHAEFYDSLADAPFEFELDCADFYKHMRPRVTGKDALRVVVSVLQGRSGHIGDYKVHIRYLDSRCEHLFTRGVTNFIEETTVGNLPTKGGGKSPHAASTEKTLQLVRQSSRRIIKIVKADLTALDTQALPQLVWNETVDRPRAEETPIPSVGLLLVQADGTLLVTGGETRPDEDGNIEQSVGGGTWMANPMR
ncbi:hypothetical protein PRIPAC_92306 [Pristionchus pacificus]|nr:hypothetical protein PRIPAC_92306 [Pristionchus pacificus]